MMNLRELELFYLNEALQARMGSQQRLGERQKPARAGSINLREALRPGAVGRIDAEGNLHLGEAGPEEQAVHEAAVKAQHEADVAVFESLGMPRVGAEAAARGRGEGSW